MMASPISLSPQKEHLQTKWPPSSACSLPPLTPCLLQRLESGHVDFPINEECTSLAIVPSGRHVVAGFTDGTLRLFDLTGLFWNSNSINPGSNHPHSSSHSNDVLHLFDSDSASDDESIQNQSDKAKSQSTTTSITTSGTGVLVCSKSHQRYGAVICQIQAKGVHTSLQMTVDVSPDGLYAFGGVARGSMELVAVDLSHVEAHIDSVSGTPNSDSCLDLLDLAQVHRHADAKLRGFGACTRLHRAETTSAWEDLDPTYILLTGKGIKNIHIWSFRPRQNLWQCLYDTQSSGSSISILHLRYAPNGTLHAISKSNSHKLRLWDLSYEQHRPVNAYDQDVSRDRPKRPPYVDLSGTETTLGIGGDFGFGGGLSEQISLVKLSAEAPFNVSELQLPSRHGATKRPFGARQQRGEMQALQQVVGMTMDGSHVLLEMSDLSVVHFYFSESVPRLETMLSGGGVAESRTMCLARIGSSGITVAAIASGNRIKVIKIGNPSSEGFWGFHGIASVSRAVSSPPADMRAIADATGAFSRSCFARKNQGLGRFSDLSSSQCEDDSIVSFESQLPGPDITRATATLTTLMTPSVKEKEKTNMIPPSEDTMVPHFDPTEATNKGFCFYTPQASLIHAHEATRDGVAVSPDSVSPASRCDRTTNEKSSRSLDGNTGHADERKKVVLRIQIPKVSNVGKRLDRTVSSGHSTEVVHNRTIDSVVPRRPMDKHQPVAEHTRTIHIGCASRNENKTLPRSKKRDSRKVKATLQSLSIKTLKKSQGSFLQSKHEINPLRNPPGFQRGQSRENSSVELLRHPISLYSNKPEVSTERREMSVLKAVRQGDDLALLNEVVADPKTELAGVHEKSRIKLATKKGNGRSVRKIKIGKHTVNAAHLTVPVDVKNTGGNVRVEASLCVSDWGNMDSGGKSQCPQKESHTSNTTGISACIESLKESIPITISYDRTMPSSRKRREREKSTRDVVSNFENIDINALEQKSKEGLVTKAFHRRPPSNQKLNQSEEVTEDTVHVTGSTKYVSVRQKPTIATQTATADRRVQDPANYKCKLEKNEATQITDTSTGGQSLKDFSQSRTAKSRTNGVSNSQSILKEQDTIETSKRYKDENECMPEEKDAQVDSFGDVAETSMQLNRKNLSKKKTFLKRTLSGSSEVDQTPKKSREVIDVNLGDIDSVSVPLPVCWQQSYQTLHSVDSLKETERRRIKLAREHRASHELLRSLVLEAVPQLVRSMSSGERKSTVEDLKDALEDIINDYTESLNDLLFRQEMEAMALAATSFLPVSPVVSFPFPEVFDQARKALSVYVKQHHSAKAVLY